MAADQFSPHMGAVARFVWGDPNPGLSNKTELRWGNHGSRSVDLDKGVWFDNEAGEGGGVMALVAREAGLKGSEAVIYLRERVGVPIEDERSGGFAPPAQKRIVATYDYRDETGELLFQVVRFDPKDFRQRRPDAKAADGWNWSVKGVRQVPYRLPEVLEALSQDRAVFIVEGEKDADRLWKHGIPATCNAGGAGKWPDGLADLFADADVVIVPDNDDAGRNHKDIVGASLRGVARTVRVLNLPGLAAKGDVSDWMAAGGSPEGLWALVDDRAVAWAPAPPASRFGAVLWASMDDVRMRHDWLIEDMLFCGDFALSYGASQSGKSFLTLDAGLSIARGVPFLGKATLQGAVIYQAGEGGLGLLSRMKAYRKHHELAASDLPFILLPSRVDLFAREGDADAFIEEVLAWRAALADPLRLIVIDTFATASPGANENASEDVSRVLHNAQRLQEAAKCAVLLVHHKNAAGEKPRGHTSLYANADTALEVIRDETNPKERTLRVAKVKDGEDGAKIGFRLQPVTIGSYDSGKPITSCVVVPAEDDDSQAGSGADKRPRTSPANKFFINALRAIIIEKGGIAPGDVPTPNAYTRVVEWPDFTRRYRTLANPDENDAAVRQRIKRSHDDLLNWRFIGRHEQWIWLTDKGERA